MGEMDGSGVVKNLRVRGVAENLRCVRDVLCLGFGMESVRRARNRGATVQKSGQEIAKHLLDQDLLKRVEEWFI